MFLSILARNGQRTRQRILDALRQHPGMNTSEIRQQTGLSWATVAYHLRILERQGWVSFERKKRGVVCFPAGIPANYRHMLAALRDSDTARILGTLLDEGAKGIAQLSEHLGLSQQSVRHRLIRLHETGLVVKRGELRPRFSVHPDVSPELAKTSSPATDERPDPMHRL